MIAGRTNNLFDMPRSYIGINQEEVSENPGRGNNVE
jgi:hypothetical protein